MRTFDLRDPEFTIDESEPERFHVGMVRPGSSLGAKHTGISMYEIPPGKAVCPLHWEAGDEEWAMSVDGPMWVRDDDGTHRVEAFQLVFFPRGPEGVHQILNDGDATVRVLMFGEIATLGASFYPDSNKVGIWTGTESADGLFVHSTAVPYFHGEPG
ncbi:MAG: Cupin 2 conserved barrel domain protein [Thermoleophilia bacterium]|nr:Cupin 2 conserved barrel domain protein [Thermoleophilia bacterium]